MPYYRATGFRDAQAAQAAAVAGIARIEGAWLAAATALDPSADAAPVVSVTPVLVEALPLGAITQATISGGVVTPPKAPAVPYSRVRQLVQSAVGVSEVVDCYMPSADVPALIGVSSALVTITSTNYAAAFVTASRASGIQATARSSGGTITIPGGAQVQHVASGKLYNVVTPSPFNTYKNIQITEVDSTDHGVATYGDAFQWLTPVAGLDPLAHAYALYGFTVPDGTGLVDANGRAYVSVGATTLADSSTFRFSGPTYGTTINVKATDSGSSAAALGATLTFTSAPTGTKTTCTIASVGGATLPAGTVLVKTSGSGAAPVGAQYAVQADVVIGDALTTSATVAATTPGTLYDLVAGSDVLGFSGSPPSNIGSSVAIVSAFGAAPGVATSQIVGAAPTWGTIINREPDGSWSAVIHTIPLGS